MDKKKRFRALVAVFLSAAVALSQTNLSFGAESQGAGALQPPPTASAAIKSLTETPVAGADYDGYIVSVENGKSGGLDASAAKKADAQVIDGSAALVQEPKDALGFASPKDITAIEPNYKVSVMEPGNGTSSGKEIEAPAITQHKTSSSASPADPLYIAPQNYQWGLKKIDASQAWSRGLNGKGVTVAILDTGLFSGHEDINSSRIVYGRNFVNGQKSTSWQDDNGHGSYVASILAAKTNNKNSSGEGIGMAGIVDDASLVIMKVLDSHGNGYLSDIISALGCIANGSPKADVVNLSLGHPGSSYAEEEVIDRLIEKGIIVIAAVGNDGNASGSDKNMMMYPAGYPGVITVGSCNSKDKASSFSSRNSSIAISAPGEDMAGITPNKKNAYKVGGSGTSFAAPVVSAAAAISKQANKKINSAAFLEQLRKTSDRGGGWNSSIGYGVLNLKKFVALVDGENVSHIHFDPVGGKSGTTAKKVGVGSAYGHLPVPSKAGHKFSGWYTSKDGGTLVTIKTVAKSRGSVTVYARWHKIYSIKFNAAGGKVGTKSKKVAAGGKYGSLPKPTRSKHDFAGWYTKKSGGARIISATAVKIKKNQTLYAHWKKH